MTKDQLPFDLKREFTLIWDELNALRLAVRDLQSKIEEVTAPDEYARNSG